MNRLPAIRLLLYFLFLILIVSQVSAAEDDEPVVTIYRVKLQIDGQLMLWETAETPPERAEGMKQEPVVLTGLLAWYGLRPGDSWRVGRLEACLERFRLALEDSCLFYAVQAYVIPPQKDPARRTLFISVTSGFSTRFGGGGVWGMFGDDNADGAWLNYRLFAGYTLVGASIGQGLPGISSWYWRTGLSYGNNGLDVGPAGVFRHDGRIDGLVGITSWPFEVQLGVQSEVHRHMDGLVMGEVTVSPAVGVSDRMVAEGWNLSGAVRLGGDIAWLLPERFLADRWTGRLVGKVGYSGFVLALQGSAGIIPWCAVDRFQFDMVENPDHGIRAAWSSDEYTFNHYLMLNNELRWRAATFPLLFISSFSIEPFLFLDAALAGTRPVDWGDASGLVAASAWDRELFATGVGVRLLLGAPVFTNFSFGVGCSPSSNADWRWKFVFSTSAGF